MRTKTVNTPAAWRADEFTSADQWQLRLSSEDVDELLNAVRAASASGLALNDVSRDDFPLPALGVRLQALTDVLEGGRGFQVLSNLPVGELDAGENQLMLWGIGTWLGEAEPQDKAGALLHEVTDTGQSVQNTANVRGFQTNNELQFHTDGADIFALLCIRQGQVGGDSRLVSSTAIFNQLVAEDPGSARVLQEPFHFDSRAQSPFEKQVQTVPIFVYHDGYISALQKRAYIELAQRFDDVPKLSTAQIKALDAVDALAADPRFSLHFRLQPGDLVLANNYSCFHARTEYQDFDEPERRRLMNRLWLTLPNGRPLPPVYADTREWGLTYRRRHGEPGSEPAVESKTASA
jgi:hypothetical protein